MLLSFLLNIVYTGLAIAVSPLLLWSSWRTGKYREGWGCKLLGLVPQRTGTAPCIWLHAVSVGEMNLLQTIIPRCREALPDHEIVISTTTQTGYALAQRKYSDHVVFYCPLDFSWAVNRALQRIRPDMLVLTELELWPNLIRLAKRHGAQVAIINGRLSEKSFRGYSRVRLLIQRVLAHVDLISVQNEAYADRFAALGVSKDESLQITGSLKFDGAQFERDNLRTNELRSLTDLQQDQVVFLAGSTQSPEEELALTAVDSIQHSDVRLILVPRHPERFNEVAELLRRRGTRFTRRSEVTASAPWDTPVLLVDVIGELGAWWGLADVGFVGGSMGKRGGQNMIEPSAYGVATCFGPNTWNFRDVVSLLTAEDAVTVVRTQAELTEFLGRCVNDSLFRRQQGKRAQDVARQHRGAADKTVALLAQQLQVNYNGNSRRAA